MFDPFHHVRILGASGDDARPASDACRFAPASDQALPLAHSTENGVA
jgi:hypothetical protein